MTATCVAAARPAGTSWVRSAEAGLIFRPMDEADLPFLRQVYAATRTDEFALVDWPEARKAAFVAQQFDAQHTHYRLHYAAMDWLIIGLGAAPAGRLYLMRGPGDHSIIDIAFLPRHRGKGLGTALLRDLLDEAGGAGRSVTLHVEKFNPAMRLYRRLGFVTIADTGVYDQMRWSANDRDATDRVEADQAETDQAETNQAKTDQAKTAS